MMPRVTVLMTTVTRKTLLVVVAVERMKKTSICTECVDMRLMSEEMTYRKHPHPTDYIPPYTHEINLRTYEPQNLNLLD